MSLIRAGGLTTLFLSILATIGLVAFGGWYTNTTTGETIGHIMLWFPISLIVSAPVGLVVFPLLYTLFGVAGRPSARVFAMVGGIIGAAIAGYALYRVRGNLAINPSIVFIALPLLVLAATLLGMLGGFMFQRLARKEPQAPQAHNAPRYDDSLPPPHPGDLKSRDEPPR